MKAPQDEQPTNGVIGKVTEIGWLTYCTSHTFQTTLAEYIIQKLDAQKKKK